MPESGQNQPDTTTARTRRRHAQHKDAAAADDSPADSPSTRNAELQQEPIPQSKQSIDSDRSRASLIMDAKKWFDNSNYNPKTALDTDPADDGLPYYQKPDSSDDVEEDVPLMSPQHAPPFVPPGAALVPPNLVRTNTRSSSADDYRSVIDDLTIENKRLKEELKRYKQNLNRDVLEKEKLFEIKVHGLPRRKKQELEATLRDFAASLGDNTSTTESSSQRKREKSTSSKERSNHAHRQHHSHNPALYLSGGSRSKHASNSSSRSRPVDSAYASMSTGAHSSGTSLVRPPFGGSKARDSSDRKVERYLEDIPQGLYPNYGLGSLGDKEKKKLIVRRLEQLFTGKIGGRYTRQGHALVSKSGTPTADALALLSSSNDKSALVVKSGSGGSGDGGSGHGGSVPVTGNTSGPHRSISTTSAAHPTLPPYMNTEPVREARIQVQHSSHKLLGSRDNASTSNSNSNGEESGNGNTTSNGHGNDTGNGGTSGGNGIGKSPPVIALPEQRPTRPLDLDPDRVQNPSENMDYIRHLGLVPPEIGPKSASTAIDVSPDANGWVYLNLLSNLAQLHIFNVASDFIRQAVVEKSTKFQVSPDGQKIRWRGGIDGTKFSSDGSGGDNSQLSQSGDGDGSDENGQRKRTKTSGHGSASAPSSRKRRSKSGFDNSGASSSFHYKPLFVRHNSSPMRSPSEEMSGQESDLLDASGANGKPILFGNVTSKGKSKSNSNSISNSNSNIDISRYEMSRSGSTNSRKRRKSDGVLVYYSGMPFCTDLAGDSGGEASPTTYLTSSGQLQESMDEALQGRPTVHRSSSGSYIPFRPLTDYLNLSRDEWAGLGLLGIGTVGRAEPAQNVAESTSSSASYNSSASIDNGSDDDIISLDYSSNTDVAPSETEELVLEASGLSRVSPEDHFAIHVVTQRPFRSASVMDIHMEDDENDDTDCKSSGNDDSNSNSNDSSGKVFIMSSLARRLAALKSQTAPFSAAVAVPNRATGVAIKYVSVTYDPREPVKLPQPAMFYPSLSQSSESEEEEDMLDSEAIEGEDESIFESSSVISRRANPHHSIMDVSLASPEIVSSGEDGDVEAGESGETTEF